jgi:hypothetical protein
MTLVGLAGVRRTHHIDVGHVGIVRLDIALQLVDKRAVRLFWVGERLGSVCLRHIANYADVSAITQPPLLPCFASLLAVAVFTDARKSLSRAIPRLGSADDNDNECRG